MRMHLYHSAKAPIPLMHHYWCYIECTALQYPCLHAHTKYHESLVTLAILPAYTYVTKKDY